MTERSKVRDWKSRVPVRVPRVQIPLSPLAVRAHKARHCARNHCLTPPGPEGSNGMQQVRCRRAPGFMRFDCFTLPPRHAIFPVCPLKLPQHANAPRRSNSLPDRILSQQPSFHLWNKVVLRMPTFFPGLAGAGKPAQRAYSPKRSTANMGRHRIHAELALHASPSQAVLPSMSLKSMVPPTLRWTTSVR